MPWLTNNDAEKAPVRVKHPSFGPDEVIVLAPMVTDEMVRKANLIANRGRDYDNIEYQIQLILSMVQTGTHVLDATTGAPIQFNDSGVRQLSPQQKQWIIGEINSKCDGMPDIDLTTERKGQKADFRKTTDAVVDKR